MAEATGFFVVFLGQVEGCKMEGVDNLYCKYSFNYGLDWSTSHGLEHGISQIAQKGVGHKNDSFVWNYPIDATFRSTNVHGWPQIVLSVYGINALGKDVIRGYGCVHMPVSPGRHVRYVRLYTPMSSSKCQQLTAWLTANPPEFFDAKFTSQARGREVTRVQSKGVAKLVVNVSTRDMEKWGYQTGVNSVSADMHHLGGMSSETAKMKSSTKDGEKELRRRSSSKDLWPSEDKRGASARKGRGRARSSSNESDNSRDGSRGPGRRRSSGSAMGGKSLRGSSKKSGSKKDS